jgi:hypothetical protein
LEANTRGFKGVWICAAIFESPTLSAVEKLLLAEVDSLTTKYEACHASNAHFAGHLGISEGRVDHLLGKLTRLGYIIKISSDGRITRRVLAPEYSANPLHSSALTAKRRRCAKNDRSPLMKTSALRCSKHQRSADKNISAPYIKEIPIESTNRNNNNRRSVTRTSKSPVEGQKPVVVVSSDSSQTKNLEALKTEFGLNASQARQLNRFFGQNGLGYVAQKAELTRSEPRKNAAAFFMKALAEDWQARVPAGPPQPKACSDHRAAIDWDWKGYLVDLGMPPENLPKELGQLDHGLFERYIVPEHRRRSVRNTGSCRPQA